MPFGATSAPAGGAISGRYTVRNHGTAFTADFTIALYHCQTADASVCSLRSTVNVTDDFAFAQSRTYTLTTTTDGAYPASTDYLRLVVDADDDVTEYDESNNEDYDAFDLTSPTAPDLYVGASAAPAGTTYVAWDNAVTVEYTLTNQGTSLVNSFQVLLYHCPGPSVTGCQLGGSRLVSDDFAPGQQRDYSDTFDLGAGSGTATDYVRVRVDGFNQIPEESETNNDRYDAISIRPPDLSLSASISPATAAPDSTVPVSFTVSNASTGGAVTNDFRYRIELCPTMAPSGCALLTATSTVSDDVVSGQDQIIATTAFVPVGAAPGAAFVRYIVDSLANIAESDETNNERYDAIVIGESLGSPCDSPSECLSGACSDGVCCDGACGGECDACAAALGASADGTCTLVSGVVCRDAAGECDPAELCTGSSATCPDDSFAPTMSACGDSTMSECTGPDVCDGAGTCLPMHAVAGAACGDTGSECTVQDVCDGSGACTDNGFRSAGTPCGDPSVDECTAADTCSGAGECLLNHTADGTACDDSAFCTLASSCMTGLCVAGAGEVCAEDEMCNEESDACLANCGNGALDLGEQCDEGAGNSDELPDRCRTDCTEPRCGDGVIDAGEACDDGAPSEACSASCEATVGADAGVADAGGATDAGLVDDGGPSTDGGGPSDVDAGTDAGPEGEVSGGCGCRVSGLASGPSARGLFGLALLAALGLRRRRRSPS